MQVPLELAFHNMQHSPELEAEIRRHVERLDKVYDRLTACRVVVEATNRSPSGTPAMASIRIELSVPGKTLVVRREPDHPGERHGTLDLRGAIGNAFHAAQRQLRKFKEQLGGELQPAEVDFRGQITEVRPADDHGFLMTESGSQLYFHRNSLSGIELEALSRGDEIRYLPAEGDSGPSARKVWPVEKD
jgi:ribosome-associated translation inhibitor RaiA/cold shock CspA family protein